MSANQKRSLLREAKQVMDASFVGGGEVASKVREHVRRAYAKIANGQLGDASPELVEAYELLRSGVRYDNVVDIFKALHALDLGLFIHAFATADDELRAIGVRPDVAAREVVTTEDLEGLDEILQAYAGTQK
jgi:hypothetical protein